MEYIFRNNIYRVGMLITPKISEILTKNQFNLITDKVYIIEGFRDYPSNGLGWVMLVRVNNEIITFHPCYFNAPLETKSGAVLYG